MTRRINPFFFEHDSKELNLSSFFWLWLKDLNLRLSMTHRSEPSFIKKLEELNFCEYDSKKWAFLTWLKKWTFSFEHDSKKWIFLNITQRIEHLFLDLTQRIEPFSRSDAKNWTFFSTCDSKNWTSFWIWFKELNFCLNYTTQSQRIEPSFFFHYDSTNRTPFFFMWFMFPNDLKNWFIFWKNSPRIDFSYDSKNGTWRKDLKFMFLKFDSKVWTFFFKTRRLEAFFKNSDAKNFFFWKIWLKELDLFCFERWLK